MMLERLKDTYALQQETIEEIQDVFEKKDVHQFIKYKGHFANDHKSKR